MTQNPDAELIELCNRLVAVEAEQSKVSARYAMSRPGSAGYGVLQARQAELGAQSDRLAAHIGQTRPATTTEGIRARAAALQAIVPADWGLDRVGTEAL